MTGGLVVMGVAGCGKTTLARALAEAIGCRFVEGDALHPPGNVAKMAAGIPLNDEDRTPFLQNVADALRGEPAVAACSALKRRYRDLIRERAAQPVRFVLPLVGREELERRLRSRAGHFMPASLLDSQLAALELPDPDEGAVLIDGEAPPADQLAEVLAALGRVPTGAA